MRPASSRARRHEREAADQSAARYQRRRSRSDLGPALRELIAGVRGRQLRARAPRLNRFSVVAYSDHRARPLGSTRCFRATSPSSKPVVTHLVARFPPTLLQWLGKHSRAASVLQAPCFRSDVIVFRLNARPRPKSSSEPALGGIRRNACTESRRLITRRSQVQILPPLLRKALETAPFASSRQSGGRETFAQLLPARRAGRGLVLKRPDSAPEHLAKSVPDPVVDTPRGERSYGSRRRPC